ncbi:hypothetical protein [Deinococcus sp.]|uniref:hypothetical protein n=1 Tax=Deinococcus sp. TaxID=47478 RepID=UPI0025DA13B4|nr:hypothetical protein [Deinococcus sp.]
MKKKFGLLALTGVIALASCSQGTNTPGSHKLTVNATGVTSASATISGVGSVTLPYSNTLTDSSYTVTPTAVTGYTVSPGATTVDLTTGDKTVSFTYTSTTSTGPGTVTPPAGTGASITITSPATGATLPSNTATQVNFTTAGTLTGVTCSVNGGTASAATVATNAGFCTVTTALVGSTTITVSGKDSAGATVTSNVVVQGSVATVFPAGVSFDPAQEIKVGADGTAIDLPGNAATDSTARVVSNNGWRQLPQGISTGGTPFGDAYTYVKGTVNVNFTPPAGTTKVEVFLAKTTGTSATPSDADVQASSVLNVAVNPTGVVTTPFDSTLLGAYQAVPEWLVFRVNGATVSFLRVVADNTAPQPARPAFDGAKLPGSNYIQNFRGIQNNNFARGKIDVFTNNRDLTDQPFGAAPAGSTTTGRVPIGFESITYVLVPSALVDVTPGLRDSDGVRLAKAIRYSIANSGAIASKPQLFPGAGDFRVMFDSTASAAVCAPGSTTPTAGVKVAGAVPDGKYRIYALTRDQIANETASPEYQVVTFDNVGPNVSAIALRDASPLPFPSTNPNRFISDVARFGGGTITDAGIGFDPTAPFVASIGSLKVSLPGTSTPSLGALYNKVTVAPVTFDTNQIADGNQTIGFNSFADVLGNLPTNCAPQTVIIDNTDPSVSFTRFTATGVVTSGTPTSIETQASDATSGVYANILFWNDFAGPNAVQTRTRAAGYVGAPVEIQRSYGSLDPAVVDNTVNVNNNATWNALFPGQGDEGAGNIEPMNVNVLVTDRAGNATILTRGVQVAQVATVRPFTIPTLGTSDGFRFDRSANYRPQTQLNPRFINALAANGTTLADAGKPLDLGGLLPSEDAVLSLSVSGTTTTNQIAGSQGGNSQLNSVTGFGGFDRLDWGKVLTYLNTAPALTSNLDTFQLADPSLVRQSDSSLGLNSNLLQSRVDSRTLNDGGIAPTAAQAAPWFKIGDLSTANQFYKVDSDLLNNLYWTRGYDNSTYSDLTSGLLPLKATYDEIAGVVTDTAGAYNFYGEKTGR